MTSAPANRPVERRGGTLQRAAFADDAAPRSPTRSSRRASCSRSSMCVATPEAANGLRDHRRLEGAGARRNSPVNEVPSCQGVQR